MLNSSIKAFCETDKFCSLNKKATCFKNPENPSCIDLILTNKHLRFQWPCEIETGLPDFYKMVLAMMKVDFPKGKALIINTKTIKNFRNETFRTSLQHEVDTQRAFIYKNGLDTFSKICTEVLEKHAPRKKIFASI